MCTAISWHGGCHYFGRNLDLERSYGECVAVTPRHFPFAFRSGETLQRHYAMIGMAHVAAGYPLYYEATNECGLSMAGLNFPESCHYHPHRADRDNVSSFELIPWVLGRCATLQEARTALARLNILAESFSPHLSASPLHWLVADKTGALTVESTADGLQVYENETLVLTNEPPFPFQRTNLRRYAALSPEEPAVPTFSRGMGSATLPGGLDSVSRFVRAAFTARCARPGADAPQDVAQFFHLLDAVAQTDGCCHLGGGAYEKTLYSCCCDTARGIYYYTTYYNRTITAVSMHREDLDGIAVVSYPLLTEQPITYQN